MRPSKATIEALDKLATDMGLTPMQRRFCEAYAADPDHNGQKAAEAAGVNPRTARTRASKWLTNANIASYMKQLMAEGKALALKRTASVVMTAAEVQERLSRQARADIGYHLELTEDGGYRVKLDPERTDIIRGIKIKSGCDKDGMPWTETELRVNDPNTPLQALARIYGLDKTDRPDPPGSRTLNLTVVLGKLSEDELRNLKSLLARAQEISAGNAA